MSPVGVYQHPRRPLAERFWAKVARADPDWCWEWRASRQSQGYGQINAGGRGSGELLAHRVAYELCVGPIPEGMTLDHLCRVRHCVNPKHLEPVTSRENTLRGVSPWAAKARQTHCKHGHPFDAANTYRAKDGTRACRECHRLREVRRKRRLLGA